MEDYAESESVHMKARNNHKVFAVSVAVVDPEAMKAGLHPICILV